MNFRELRGALRNNPRRIEESVRDTLLAVAKRDQENVAYGSVLSFMRFADGLCSVNELRSIETGPHLQQKEGKVVKYLQ